MSWNPAIDFGCPDKVGIGAIDTLIVPRTRDLGDFEVTRALPAPERQMVGPFIFFDQAGPAELLTGQGVDVRPHPPIGLGTVTYLFRGDVHHRDSTGCRPDHPSRRVELDGCRTRRVPLRAHLCCRPQWPEQPVRYSDLAGTSDAQEDMVPSFEHHSEGALPMIEDIGVSVRLILGNAYGKNAPARMFSETFYAGVTLEAGRRLPMPDDQEDRGIYIVEGSISVASQEFGASQMMVFRPGDRITIADGAQGARLMILGGATFPGPRYIWWNFVAFSQARIEEAKSKWRAQNWGKGRFDLPGDDRDEHIPLPD